MADDTKRKLLIALSTILDDHASHTRNGNVLVINELLSSRHGDNYLEFELNKHLKTKKKPRVEMYVTATVQRYSLDDFRSRFRMSRPSFEVLLRHIGGLITEHNKRSERKLTIDYEKQLLVYIHYAATQDSMIRTADLFGICEASVFNIVGLISELIVKHLLQTIIVWPSGPRVQEVIDKFHQKKGFPKVIGAVDGSHIPIKSPVKCPENYINRKQFHSINVCAICDPELRFTFVYVGWPGSAHDSRVFKNSEISITTEDDNGKKRLFPDGSYILGDSAYELTDYLMTPFKDFGKLTRIQKDYNYKHSATRVVIENAFGILKGRFRRLKYVNMHNLQRMIEFITSCFVIHNICLESEADLDEYLNEGLPQLHDEIDEPRGHLTPTAVRKRQAIAELLSM